MARAALIRRLVGVQAAIGPEQPWLGVKYSAALAARAWECLKPESWPVDTEQSLAALVIHADQQTGDLQRARALAPVRSPAGGHAGAVRGDVAGLAPAPRASGGCGPSFGPAPPDRAIPHGSDSGILGDGLSDPNRVMDFVIALAGCRGKPSARAQGKPAFAEILAVVSCPNDQIDLAGAPC
jgi:hypothetical protein